MQFYLVTHVWWRVASIGCCAVLAFALWTVSRIAGYIFLAVGVGELMTLPRYWRRARRLHAAHR